MRAHVTLRAFAKINVHLRVGQQDPASGYHALETIFQTIGLFDTVRLDQAETLLLRGQLGGLPQDERNIVFRAALALRAFTGCPRGALIHLTKRIPVAAGLGGGSSDAAATLVGLNCLWKTRLTTSDLRYLAKDLGADVPFLVGGGAAAGTGRGDRLLPLEGAGKHWGIVLITSQAGISTAEGYAGLTGADKSRALTLGSPEASRELRGLTTAWERGEWPDATVNSFERSVFERRPRLGALVQTLRQNGAVAAHLSGSGPSIFGVFDGARHARRVLQGLHLDKDEYARVVSPVLRSPVLMPQPRA